MTINDDVVHTLPFQEIVTIDMPDAFGFEEMLEESCLCRRKGSWDPPCPFGIDHGIETFRYPHSWDNGRARTGMVMKFPEDIPWNIENEVTINADGNPVFDVYYETDRYGDSSEEVEVAPAPGRYYVRNGNEIFGHFDLMWTPHDDPPPTVLHSDYRTVFPDARP